MSNISEKKLAGLMYLHGLADNHTNKGAEASKAVAKPGTPVEQNTSKVFKKTLSQKPNSSPDTVTNANGLTRGKSPEAIAVQTNQLPPEAIKPKPHKGRGLFLGLSLDMNVCGGLYEDKSVAVKDSIKNWDLTIANITGIKRIGACIEGVTSGQNALYGHIIDSTTGVARPHKCKLFPHGTHHTLSLRHNTLKGFIIAEYTSHLCPEVVIPSTLYKNNENQLVFAQPIKENSTDFSRAHKAWLAQGNDGNITDFLEKLLKSNSDLEENFIVASLAEIAMGSIDSKAANMLFCPTTNEVLLCDTDIALANMLLGDELGAVSDVGRGKTPYLCKVPKSDGTYLNFMQTPFSKLVDKYPKVKAFLEKANRAENGNRTYQAKPSTRVLLENLPTKEQTDAMAIITNGTSLVKERINMLNLLAENQLHGKTSLNDFLPSRDE